MYDAILKEVRSEIHKGASAALFAGDLEARRGEIGERLRAGSGHESSLASEPTGANAQREIGFPIVGLSNAGLAIPYPPRAGGRRPKPFTIAVVRGRTSARSCSAITPMTASSFMLAGPAPACRIRCSPICAAGWSPWCGR